MANAPGTRLFVIAVFVGALGVGALAWYVKAEPGARHVAPPAIVDSGPSVSFEKPRPARRHHTTQSAPTVTVMVPVLTQTSASLSKRSIEVPDGTDAKEFVARKVLEVCQVEGVKVLGVEVQDGTASIDFDDGIDSGMGTDQESLFLKALQVSYGQFPDVERVAILKHGTAVKSLGQLELTGPLPVQRGPSGASDARPVER